MKLPSGKWLTLFCCFLFLGVGISLISDYGMSWDEPTRWKSGDAKLDYYEGLFQADEDGKGWGSAGRDLYPGLFDLPLAALDRYGSIDRFWWGHFFSLLYGMLGASAAGGIAYLICRSWWAFAFTFCCVVLMPRYFGHMFMNPKDIPFAGVYTLGVFLIVWRLFRDKAIGWRDVAIVGAGVGIAMSMRTAGGILIAYAGLCCFLREWMDAQRMTARAVVKSVGLVAGLLLVAFPILIIFWPYAHQNPFKASTTAVVDLQTDAAEKPLLFMGELVSAGDASAFYLPWMWLIVLPVGYFLLLAISGCFFAKARLQYGDWTGRDWLRFGFVLFAVLFPFAYIVLTQAVLHNGVRHTLFLFPPFCAFLGVLVFESNRYLSQLASQPRLKYFLAGVVGLLLVSNVYALVRLHPYQYVFYNTLIGGTSGAYGHYETEYWFTSNREAVEWLDAFMESEKHPQATVLIAGPHHAIVPFLPESMQIVYRAEDADYLILNTQMLVNELFEGEEIYRIERDSLPICIIKRRAVATEVL